MYIKRFMDGLLAKAMETSNSVLVTGPRQVGKSTMISHVLPELRYVTLDDPFVEEQAKNDSRTFMQLNPPPVAIDEVQHPAIDPGLWVPGEAIGGGPLTETPSNT